MKHLYTTLLSIILSTIPSQAYTLLEGKIEDSSIYPSTTHQYIISIPEGYDGSPACLYVGLDGILCNAPAQIDSLIESGDIPYIIGVYVDPGKIYDSSGSVIRYNRSNEFDATDSRFATFLESELLPAVKDTPLPDGKKINIKQGGEHAMIFGLSSGGIAAFTAGWHRPDLFSRVFAGCGTFVPMRGGDGLQAIVRKHEPKALRICLQDGYDDCWNPIFGSWFAANSMLGTALEFAGYDTMLDWGEGVHSVRRSTQIFPEVMKWMWRDYPTPPQTGKTRNGLLAPILEGGGQWLAGAAEPYEPSTKAVYPDGSLIAEAEPGSNYLMQSVVDCDGTEIARQRFYWLHTYDNSNLLTGGMAFDGDGNLWVVTNAGIQICDQNGRVRGILSLPQQMLSDISGSRIEIYDGEVKLFTRKATYRRRLGVKAATEGVRPPSQGQA